VTSGVEVRDQHPSFERLRDAHGGARPTVTSADGTRLWVDVIGRGGPPLFLLNGIFCSTHYFEPMIDRFAPERAVVAWDYPGHGRSEVLADPWTLGIGRLADDAERVLTAVTDEPAVVIGHSMGVRVALELYRRVPDRIRGIVLLCGSVDQALGPALDRSLPRALVARAFDGAARLTGSVGRFKAFVARTNLVPMVAYATGGMSRRRTPREPVDALLRNVGAMDAAAFMSLARSYVEHSARALLAHVRVPTLVVAGERDGLAPPTHCESVVAGLRDAELWVAPECTHLALVEDPLAVNARIQRFIERCLR
jgi:pimeloyl-ACP methyl ester carboxylesterase